MKIIAHTLVKNEENFIWFAVNSVIDHVDKIMVWDNGSTDKTFDIVQLIKSPKVEIKNCGETDKQGTATLRQKMLDETDADWIFILDGDEIWWNDSIEKLIGTLGSTNKDVIVTHPTMLIGDMFHYQEEAAGKYHIAGRVGHYNIRAIRNIPGLHIEGMWPNEAYVTQEDIKVQDQPPGRMLFFDEPYLHASYLARSPNDRRKTKYEIGKPTALDFYYPEVLFKSRPENIPSPWQPMSTTYKLLANLETPLKKLKRRLT